MYNFKINKIITNNNSIISPKSINIIIGPNNCGKSQFLKDIKNTLQQNYQQIPAKIIIKNMEYELPHNKTEFIDRYGLRSKIFSTTNNQYYIRNYSGINNSDIVLNNSISNYLDTGNVSINQNWESDLERQIINFTQSICNNASIPANRDFPINAVVHTETFVEYEQNGEIVRNNVSGSGGPLYSEIGASIDEFINTYGNLFLNYLGTEEKLLMCKKQKKYGLQDNNTNFLSEVQFNSEMLNKLSDHTKKMFNKDVYLDRFSWGDSILFRVGDNFDFIRNSSRNDSSVELKLQNYTILDREGDGIKNFITNYMSLFMNDKNILLLDEPESFLHPPLAKQLGEIIAKAADDTKQIFISTHSVDLLKGILNINKDVNIIRITRHKNENYFNLIEKEKIVKILSNPMLASSNVLNGLFCEKVYIFEAESDEEFFQCLHDKVNIFDSSFFTHAKNKQTIKDISSIYNDLKILNYSIYDFDILKNQDFNKAINGIVEENIKNNYIDLRKKLNNIFTDNDYKNGGIDNICDLSLKKKIENMLEELKKYNIIIHKNGCLESCLIDVGIPFTNNKNKWFKDAVSFINENSLKKIKSSYIYNWIYLN